MLLKWAGQPHRQKPIGEWPRNGIIINRPQSYKRFTSLYYQACEYESFVESLVVPSAVEFSPLMLVGKSTLYLQEMSKMIVHRTDARAVTLLRKKNPSLALKC